MTRNEALTLLREHLTNENLVRHCLATEVIMAALAERLGKDIEKWRVAGLVHDLDFEETKDTPDQHGLKTVAVLEEKGLDPETLQAVRSHNEALGVPRESDFDHALACAETITGLIVATALVQPDKKLASVRPESVIKRMKKKDFARSVNRDAIRECEMLDIPLPDFAALSVQAMSGIAGELGL
ncbi:MAG: HDIG domain-containing protein [Planctomycetes bacterium]|nr:HDIG domain-containing protein [Planctomycetota bacterium]